MTTTHTLVRLQLSTAAYNEIRDKFQAAGYDHAILENGIDMSGIAIVPMCEKPEIDFTTYDPNTDIKQDLAVFAKQIRDSIRNQNKWPMTYLISRDEIMRLRASGVIDENGATTAPSPQVEIDVESFLRP